MAKPFFARQKKLVGRQSRASDVAVVKLEKGGLGWQVVDETGRPIKLKFGKLLDVGQLDPESPAYKASVRAIDETLKKAKMRRRKFGFVGVQPTKRFALRRAGSYRKLAADKRD